ncbi:hypothetical protein RR49_01756 [Microbacterium ginsengisoli]|uniref:Uncharacterized protein n=1 Tax=Microbacterium ginsengisoli TaxID=400772 RepID=A0A0F0LVU2_9MICO|nr:hypothetical protein RR49_01756 [Microbacterium ginsengisoli]
MDTQQLDGLREFRAAISERGLLGEFANTGQLGHEVWKAIEYDIASLELSAPQLPATKSGVRFAAQPQQERELTSYDSKGKPRYSTRHWIDITNTGDQDATDVRFEVVGENSSMILTSGDEPTVIHAGQTRRLHVLHHMGGGDPDIIRIRWSEDDEQKEREFHVG